MKFLRFYNNNKIIPAMLDSNGEYLSLEKIVSDITIDGLAGLDLAKLNKNNLKKIAPPQKILAPFNNVGKCICIGLNYKDHAEETKSNLPKEPMIFSKFNNALTGPFDEIHIPKGSKFTDWEVELVIVIGKSGLNIQFENASEHIFGYCLGIDFSERRFQKEMAGQFIKGKSYDSFAPIGPYLVTKDEIADVDKLNLSLKVNAVQYQNDYCGNMIFKPNYLVSYVSQFFKLLPGDIIFTGTPSGVGAGVKPNPVFLKEKDLVEASITNLGTQLHKMVQDN